MELKYIVMTIIKILISVPAVLMVSGTKVHGTALMGGHLDNTANLAKSNQTAFVETIPDPSALVVPGYNLPENIFNKGKPFYLEKDPLTGKVDFDSGGSLLRVDYDDEFEYIAEDESNSSVYDKANIDRKDGSLSSHKPSDVNQLTPNFHDFLNLPVKYNPDKYVYPLISSSYANTKVQGNVNKYHNNHKNYIVTTYKPTPSYHHTVKNFHFEQSKPTETTSSTTTSSTTMTAPVTKNMNLMENDMRLDEVTTPRGNADVFFTTTSISSSTKRPLSLFEQLFGEYEDEITTIKPKPPLLFSNLPNKYEMQATKKPTNVLSGTDMGHENAYEYEYEDVAEENKIYQTKPVKLNVQTTTSSSTIKTSPSTTTTSTTTTPPTTSTTTTTSSTTTSRPTFPPEEYEYYDSSLPEEEYKRPQSTTELPTATKVTSLPLGENHYGAQDLRPPIIALTNNLKQQLNNEKVIPPVPSSNNVRISPDQDSVSFVVGHHQNVAGTSFKEGVYDNGPFRPLIITSNGDNKEVSYSVEATPVFSQNFHVELGGSSVNIQPIRTSEASLSIGVPIEGKRVPGQVVNENLESEKIEFPKKGTGAKIVFPEDVPIPSRAPPMFHPPPPPPSLQQIHREVLHLNSKPMFHQLPSDLTPPSEQEPIERARPPWDPRPGHFYNGRPEYIRPPRPPQPQLKPDIYKRIDNLPNILPQFRPNTKASIPHHYDLMTSMKHGYLRQPLLDRPSNKPVGFFEKLIPPPPPKNLHNLRKVPILELRNSDELKKQQEFEVYHQYQTPPPQPILANRRQSDEPAVETLQMIQAKHVEKKDSGKVDKPLYVVYPVNSAPIKLDALDSAKKETVVVGTRAELPLPPSKINHQEFTYESPQDRNDAPVLKPHPKPNFPIKSDFPYPLERPSAYSEPHLGNNNNLDTIKEEVIVSLPNNQWDVFHDAEPRIVNNNKINYKNPNQISATLKTYTDKPIAVAYTPTEPYKKTENTEKYSMPNYASPVISEIRPAGLIDKAGNEITVSAVMHTHSQIDPQSVNGKPNYDYTKYFGNHNSDLTDDSLTKHQGFQAPFQASVNVDGMTQGWTVVRNDKSKIDRSDQDVGDVTTVMAVATTGEFDIENFKPQLFGGFQPLYNFSDEGFKGDETARTERQERTV